jgi:hypothetical protein
MFSRILVKLVDEAIVPAIALFAAKIGSALFLARYYHIDFSITGSGFVYTDKAEFIFINSYSTVVVVAVIGLGLLYNLTKSHLFHETHVSPGTAARLYSFRLSRFIQTSFDLYSQGVVWLSYSILTFLATLAMFYFQFVYSWVLWVSAGVTLVALYLFIIDVEREVLVGNTDSDFEVVK